MDIGDAILFTCKPSLLTTPAKAAYLLRLLPPRRRSGGGGRLRKRHPLQRAGNIRRPRGRRTKDAGRWGASAGRAAPPRRNATPPGRRCPVLVEGIHSEGVQTEGGLGGELQDGGGLWGGHEGLVATGGALRGGGSTGERRGRGIGVKVRSGLTLGGNQFTRCGEIEFLRKAYN